MKNIELKTNNEIDERLARPIGNPPLNIVEGMNVFYQTIYYGNSTFEDELDEVYNQVKENNDLETELNFLSRIYAKDEKKTHFLQEFLCSHPLYGVFEKQAVCTVCGKKFSFDHDKLKELIDSKKLVADGIAFDGDVLYPIKKDSLKNIREYYLEEYTKNSDKDNVEQSVWNHFCQKENNIGCCK